jgi:hypothetical protein
VTQWASPTKIKLRGYTDVFSSPEHHHDCITNKVRKDIVKHTRISSLKLKRGAHANTCNMSINSVNLRQLL